MLKVEKTFFLFFLVLFVLSFSRPGFAKDSTADLQVKTFQKNLNGILSHSCLKKNNYGIKIYSLDKGETLFQVRNDKLFIPASNLKLLTTALALKHLGPNHRFITRLYALGSVSDGILKGDLFIKGFGDPKLVTEQMWLLANQLKHFPTRKVEGDIVADESYFDSERHVGKLNNNSTHRAYDAPLGALSFNFNTAKVLIKPGEKAGDPALVMIDPESDYIKLVNRAITREEGRRNRLSAKRIGRKDFDEIVVKGSIALDSRQVHFYRNITDPPLYTAKILKSFLSKAGVYVAGNVRRGLLPDHARLLVEHESEPLSIILSGLNKFSNNFTAEQVLKFLGAKKFGAPGTTEKGLKLMREYVRFLGYSPDKFQVRDGSGLSRKNRVSPDLIVDVLKDAHENFGIYPDFVASLGVMGIDGSVKDRMPNSEESTKVRAKTGTLNSVSSLSGYFQSKGGERFAFSIIMNDLKCSNWKAIKLQDKIVQQGLQLQRNSK